MTTLHKAAQQALEALEADCGGRCNAEYNPCWQREAAETLRAALAEDAMQKFTDVNQELEAALAEPVQEPVAWSHNLIDNIITHRPADLERHPERWTALYSEPQPCPTCEALARTVMLDQTSHDTAPPQRKPLTEAEIDSIWDSEKTFADIYAIARAIERAHNITGDNT